MLNETYRAMLGHKSVIRETFMYGKQRAAEIGYENVFDYSLGNPSVPCPDKFTKAMQTLLAEEEPVALHGYCPSQGDPGFRTAVAAHLAKTFGLPYEQKDIFPTTGAAGGAAHPPPARASYNRYGRQFASVADWRRDNVDVFIKALGEEIHRIKPWVKFGVSPFGIYRNKKSTADGSGSNTNGLQNYDDLYADITYWVQQGWIDYNIPQIYWEIGHPAADYITLIKWWDKNANGGHLYIGQDVARTMKADQLTRKMRYERALPHVSGNCFWPANEILWNNKGVADSLRRNYHRYPALIPAYTHMHNRPPKDVSKLKTEWTPKGFLLHWQAEQSPTNPELASYFVVYRFNDKEPIDTSDPSKIVAITRETGYLMPYEKGKVKYRYVVTAVDRFHNESEGKTKKVKL